MKHYLSIIISLVFFSGCLNILVGFHNPKHLSDDQIRKEAEKQNIHGNILLLKTEFMNYFSALDTSDLNGKTFRHDLGQPLQVFCFDSSGKAVSYMVNCYSYGPSGDWNWNGYFNQFPPATAVSYDVMLHLDTLSTYFKGPITHLPAYTKNTVVVFWNKFWRKESKDLIEVVQKNLFEYASSDSVQILYVNNDNFCSHLYLDK